jgi:hypothetical protein
MQLKNDMCVSKQNVLLHSKITLKFSNNNNNNKIHFKNI